MEKAEQGQGGWKYEDGETTGTGPKELVPSSSLEGFQPVPDKGLSNLV